jgi:hypothetical protein
VPPPEFRLRLDQGFPKPPGFAVQHVDNSVEVVSLSDFDASLSRDSTPDWILYCVAAEAGFNAIVARDRSQLDQLVEMYVLSRLDGFSVITWRRGIDDPIRVGAGKRIARYRRVDGDSAPIGLQARRRGISVGTAPTEARSEIRDWLHLTGADPTRFDELLDL